MKLRINIFNIFNAEQQKNIVCETAYRQLISVLQQIQNQEGQREVGQDVAIVRTYSRRRIKYNVWDMAEFFIATLCSKKKNSYMHIENLGKCRTEYILHGISDAAYGWIVPVQVEAS